MAASQVGPWCRDVLGRVPTVDAGISSDLTSINAGTPGRFENGRAIQELSGDPPLVLEEHSDHTSEAPRRFGHGTHPRPIGRTGFGRSGTGHLARKPAFAPVVPAGERHAERVLPDGRRRTDGTAQRRQGGGRMG